MKEYYVIGLMSGTSLDGLDIAYCKFVLEKGWSFEILNFNTFNYDSIFREKLRQAPFQKESDIKELSYEFGCLMANELKQFVNRYGITEIDAVSTHGHTVFHQPDKGITLQIGDPKPIYDLIQKPVVYDFRSQDVALGGQGAPLVPLVDKLLFADYDACLNLGGFSNISFDIHGSRIAFDICPVNIVLNLLSVKLGYEYDNKGQIALKGSVDIDLLDQLNNLDYYKNPFPKSLAWEWVVDHILPLFDQSCLSVENQMRTFVEHIAIQISSVVKRHHLISVFLTGGGVYHDFLLKRLAYMIPNVWVHADDILIEGKEAMAFAFLGLLKLRGEDNVLSSVTGCVKNHCSGSIYSKEL